MRRDQTLFSALYSAKFLGPLGVALAFLALALGVPTLSDVFSVLCYILATFFGVLTVIGFKQSLESKKRRGRNEFQEWYGQIKEWVLDENKSLSEAQYDDPRLGMAQNLTREVLRWQDSEGKRDVLLNLYNWSLIQSYPGPAVNLKDADFSGSNLEGVNLRRADLGQVNLKNADLRDAHLSASPENDAEMNPMWKIVKRLAGSGSCDLRNADLRGTVLANAVLAGCVLTGADFERADLRGTDLREAYELTQEQINKAYGSYRQKRVADTRLPEGLVAPDSWRKPLYKQKREKTLAKLERAHAGP